MEALKSTTKYVCSGNKTEEIIFDEDITLHVLKGVPLETGPCKELTIKSSNGSKVVIETEDAYSPCIGKSSIIHEDTGYVLRQDNTLKKIILDNVHLRLVPKHTAFSIGTLGAEDFPTIELRNGASIEGCPEVLRVRKLGNIEWGIFNMCKKSDVRYYLDDLTSDGITAIRKDREEATRDLRCIKESYITNGVLRIPADFTNVCCDQTPICKEVREIVLPDGVAFLSGSTFKNCVNLEEIRVACKYITIGTEYFCGCKNLTMVNGDNYIVADAVKSRAFANTGLREIHLESRKLDEGIFSNCLRLVRATLKGSRANASCMFENCYNLEEVTLSENFAILPKRFFCYCENLKSVSLNEGNIREVGDYAFAGCSNLSNVGLSRKLRYLGTSCFNGCLSLGEIPTNYLQEVHDHALANSGITKLALYKGLTKFSSNAIENTVNLNVIYVQNGIAEDVLEEIKCASIKYDKPIVFFDVAPEFI